MWGRTTPWPLAAIATGVAALLLLLAPVASAADPTVSMVKDVAPGADSSGPTELTDLNGTLFFVTTTPGAPTFDLWSSNGTAAGTSEVKALVPAASNAVQDMIAAGNRLFFVADDGSSGQELWTSTGTAGGTGMVKDIRAGAGNGAFPNLTDVGGKAYFTGNDGVHGYEPWSSNGTAAGTTMAKDVCASSDGDGMKPLSYPDIGNLNGIALFSGRDCLGGTGDELWRSNGTSGGTTLVKDINPNNSSPTNPGSGPQNFIQFGGNAYFDAGDGSAGQPGAHGGELWKTNGTGAGTVMVKDINPGDGGSGPDDFAIAGGSLFFRAGDGSHGAELWKTDGTGAHTTMVADINPGSGASNPTLLTAADGKLFFFANDGTHGLQLYVSDGTGATRLTDVALANGGGAGLVAANGRVFFDAVDTYAAGGHGDELWMSDGTATGTKMVADIKPGSSSSLPGGLSAVGNTLYFSADDGSHGTELWKATVPAPPDTTPPQTTITSGPANGAEISDPSPSFAFKANEPASFQCRVDGGGWSHCTSPDQLGPLAGGTHSFAVRAIDTADNVDPTPAARSFTVKTDTGPSAACKKAKHKLRKAKKSLKKANKKLKKTKKHGNHRKLKKAKQKVKKAKKAVKHAKHKKGKEC